MSANPAAGTRAVARMRTVRGTLVRAFVALAALALLAVTQAGAQGPSAVDADTDTPTTTVRQLRFHPLERLDQAVDDASPAWQTVPLPHHWAGRGQSGSRAGIYRWRFIGTQTPDLQALRFDAVSERSQLRLNGHLLHDGAAQQPDRHIYRALPLLVSVPPALLRQGANDLELRVEHGAPSRAQLAGVTLGPHAALEAQHQQRLRWLLTVPQNINLLAMVIGALLVLLWARRRQEVPIGLFGAVFLSGSARNYGYYSEAIVPAALWDGFQYVSVIWNAVLALLFALHHTAHRPDAVRWPRLRHGLLLGATALTVLAVLAVAIDPTQLAVLRRISYPFLLPLDLCVVVLLAQHGRRLRSGVEQLLALTYAVMTLSVALDLLLVLGLWSGVGQFTVPYTMPVLLAVFSLVLLNRVLEAMRAAEDLTEVLERRVAERTADVQAAHDAKARFLAAASHDLRQPLNTIGLQVAMLREKIQAPEIGQLVDRVQASVDGMSSLLGGLLDLSRLDGGALRPRFEPVALQPLLQQMAASAGPQALAKGLELRVAPCRAWVWTDRVLLDSMLRNLVSNAIRYTHQGQVLVGARRRSPGRIELQVIDTGVGMSEAEQARVFDEFYRGHAARGGEPGFGLGLSIVHRAAQLLNQPLRLRSAPGKGTQVGVELELWTGTTDDSTPAGPAAATDPMPPLEFPMPHGTFIAVLEDDAAQRRALRDLLRQWGCHVVDAESPDELLVTLQAHLRTPDLLISDFRLGTDVDGLQAVEALRTEWAAPKLPALLITAETDEEIEPRAHRLGVQVLRKPVPPPQLAAVVATGLASAQPRSGQR